jgi:CDI immunity proteins
MQVNLEETLEQIENDYWNEPTYTSYLVTTCHQLRKKPLKDFTIEDLRIMIGQNISLEILVPMAIERLKQDILAEGHCYPGDLLKQLLIADIKYWEKNPVLHRKLCKLFSHNQPSLEKRVGKSIDKGTYKRLVESYEAFIKINDD